MRAGAAAVPITPLAEHLAGEVYLGGYGFYRSRPAEGKHDELWARTLVLAEGDTRLAIVALDLVGISNIQLAAIRAEAAAATGLPPANILIASTHTHHSPDLQGLWGGAPAAYKEHLRHQAVLSIRQAAASQGEARLEAASSRLTGVTRNRRGWDDTDDVLTVLRLTRADGEPLATLVNFGVHPTVMGPDNRLVSCDFPCYLREALERELGGVALYVNGAEGDSEPNVSGDFAAAQAYGQAMAEAALLALRDAQPLAGPLLLTSEAIDLPIEHPQWRQVVDAGLLEYDVVTREERPCIETRVSYLRLGDGPALQALSLPGEAVTRLGQAIRTLFSAPHGLLLGLTHDTLGYLMPDDEWKTGRNNDYEESVSLGPNTGPAVHVAVTGLVRMDR